MPQYLGRAQITVNGSLLPTLPGAKLNIGGLKRTTVTPEYGAVGYTEERMPATLECELVLGADTTMEDLKNTVDATVMFAGDNGLKWVMRNAHATETIEVSGKDGKYNLKLAGEPAERM